MIIFSLSAYATFARDSLDQISKNDSLKLMFRKMRGEKWLGRSKDEEVV